MWVCVEIGHSQIGQAIQAIIIFPVRIDIVRHFLLSDRPK